MIPLWCDILLNHKSSLTIRHTQGLPVVGIVDVIRIVKGRVAGIVGIGTRMQVAKLIGTIVMTIRHYRGRTQIADASRCRDIDRGGIDRITQLLHEGVEYAY